MRNWTKACLFGGALFSAGIAQARPTAYVLAGPDGAAAPESGGYAWDAQHMVPLREALENLTNFGHLGLGVKRRVITESFSYLGADTVGGADGIISPWWYDADVGVNEQYGAAYHFLHGGDLFLFQDSSYTDAIGSYLGIPTTDGYGGSFSGTSFPFDGPFGVASSVVFTGTVGTLNPADVAAHHGTVLATNPSGSPVIAYWDRGEYAPGAGRMIIVTDVNTIGDDNGTAQYNPLNDNGRFALNLIAGMIDEPASCNPADVDGNGILNLDDIAVFAEQFLNGCP
ncbi:MAG: hypothetical protein R3B49_10945 [Phycisphaerales bacterium]